MRWYSHTDGPLSLHGTVNVRFERMARQDAAAVSEKVQEMAVRSPGARIRFATDSEKIAVVLQYAQAPQVDLCMALCGASGADVYIGEGFDAKFLGAVIPKTYDQMSVEAEIAMPEGTHTVTITLPRNTPLASVRVGVCDGAKMLPAPIYSVSTPILFYGSSITEGGCASRPSMAYTALVCRWLDADYRNLGFSGAALGEPAMADYIARQPMSALVYDYDHNTPDEAHLKKTHEPFFQYIRKMRPELPILIMSRPDVDHFPLSSGWKRDIVRTTYENAVASGDQRVWFLDGHTFFEGPDRSFCTVDRCHPTDLGFYRMAQKVYPVLCQMLAQPNRAPWPKPQEAHR